MLVTVHIDVNLGISVSKVLHEGATVLTLKGILAQDDPTGRTKVEDFVLACLDGTVLSDETPITDNLHDIMLRERSDADASPPAVPEAPDAQVSVQAVWEVIGGADRGGILVRFGPQTSSPQLADRLATGAFIAELALEGERLQYRLLAGAGPGTGWVSTKLKEKVLVQRRPDRQPGDFPEGAAKAASSEPAEQGSNEKAGARGGRTAEKETDPYKLLGVPHDAKEAAINSAFRKVSLRIHPDHCPDDPDAPAKFLALMEAKTLLLDPGRRHLYDMKHGIGQAKAEDIVAYGTGGAEPGLVPIMLFRELAFTERLGIAVSDMRTGQQTHLPLKLFAAKDGSVRVGSSVVELGLLMGIDPVALAEVATMDAVCEGDEMPQLRANGEEDEELPARSGNLHRAIITIMDLPKALGLASPLWLKKNNSVQLSQLISQRLTEVAFEADFSADPLTIDALAMAQTHTACWWSSG